MPLASALLWTEAHLAKLVSTEHRTLKTHACVSEVKAYAK